MLDDCVVSVVGGDSGLPGVSVVTATSVAGNFGLAGVSVLNVVLTMLEDSVFVVISDVIEVSGV